MDVLNWLTYPFRRGPRRPLADRQPSRSEMGQARDVPLGMEATDLDMGDRVSRENDMLERSTQLGHEDGRHGYRPRSGLAITPMPDNETYAARYHRAFVEKGRQDD